MHSSLSKLATLPDDTVVYNGHEYTAGNVAFAKTVEPGNPAIGRLFKLVQENKVTTGLSTIGDEKEWNVFMRLDKDAIKYVVFVGYSRDADFAIGGLRVQRNLVLL
jgi:hydroxyacylglutathione hydrolase